MSELDADDPFNARLWQNALRLAWSCDTTLYPGMSAADLEDVLLDLKQITPQPSAISAAEVEHVLYHRGKRPYQCNKCPRDVKEKWQR